MNRDDDASAMRLMKLLATVGAALVLIVIVASAYLRLTQAGLSCADWPGCYGRGEAAAGAAITSPQRVARIAHRIAATAVAAVLLALALIAWTQRPAKLREGMIAIVCVGIAVGLAALGVVTPGARLPAVTLANFGGGFALLGLLWWLRLSVDRPPSAIIASPLWVNALAALALVAAIGQIALGALVSAKFAALSCPGFPRCGTSWPAGSLGESVDLFQPLLVGVDGTIVRPAALAALHWAHRIGALLVVALVGVVAAQLVLAQRRGRRLGLLLLGLVATQAALGAGAVITHLPLVVVVAHNLTAALLLLALVTLNARAGAGGAPA